jgi:hypothetical protein
MELMDRWIESSTGKKWSLWVGVTAYVLLTFAWISCIAWSAVSLSR